MRSTTRIDNNSTNLGKDLQDITAFLGVTSFDNKENTPDDSTSNAKSKKETTAKPSNAEDARFEKEHAHDTQEMARRSEFVQHLLLSTIF